jgi:hypothetical protein
MPASLSSITSKRATLYVPLDENDPDSQKVKVVYRPKSYDKKFERHMNKLLEEKKDDDELIAAAVWIRSFLHIVQAWDLKWDDADEEPIPLTEEALEDVPTEVISGIVRAIGEDQQTDPKAGSDSQKRS